MPAFRLPDDGNCPVFKIPEISRFSNSDVRPMELTNGSRIRIAFRDRRKPLLDVTFVEYVEHPYWNEMIMALRVRTAEKELPIINLEEIDTITKTAVG